MFLVTCHLVLATSCFLPHSTIAGIRRGHERQKPCLGAIGFTPLLSPLRHFRCRCCNFWGFMHGLLKKREKVSSACQVSAADKWEARQWLLSQTPPGPATWELWGHESYLGCAGCQLPDRDRDISHSSWTVALWRWVHHQSCYMPQALSTGDWAMEIKVVNESESLFL